MLIYIFLCIIQKHFSGVPISSQWKKEGHYYPTQICQFALSHWSKQILLEKKTSKGEEHNAELPNTKFKRFHQKISESSEVRKTIYEDGLDVQSDDWQGSTMTRVIRDSCVHFESEITLPLNNDKGMTSKIIQSGRREVMYNSDLRIVF